MTNKAKAIVRYGVPSSTLPDASSVPCGRPENDVHVEKTPRALWGQIVERCEFGHVTVLVDGIAREARVPLHVDHEWLQRALTHGPVDASVVEHENVSVLAVQAVFPGVVHAGIEKSVHLSGEHVVIEATSGVEVRCGSQALRLGQDGRAELRGRELMCEAEETNYVRGATVRLN